MKKEGKITVKHYLNFRAKEKLYSGEKYYPLYVQIIVAGQKAQIKSRIRHYFEEYGAEFENLYPESKKRALIQKSYFTEKELTLIQGKSIYPLSTLFHNEIEVIEKCIRLKKPFSDPDFNLVNFSSHYGLFMQDIFKAIDNELKSLYQDTLKNLFDTSSQKVDKNSIFKLSNYLIHFINWGNSFSDFYEQTYEVLPSELKKIENTLPEKLKLQIKSLLTLKSKFGKLQRELGKRDKGHLPAVLYFDWEESGREFVEQEFSEILTEKQVKLYLSHIDELVEEAFMNHNAF